MPPHAAVVGTPTGADDVPEAGEEEDATFAMEEDAVFGAEEEGTFAMEEEHDGAVLLSSAGFWNRLQPSATQLSAIRVGDWALAMTIVAIAYGLVTTTGALFSSAPYVELAIDTSLGVLPSYAVQSLVRMAVGYFVSLVFAIGYAYVAYRKKFAAQILMLIIDVLQSIPLLSFLPGVVLSLIAIFPGARIGVELSAVLLIFTSCAWNLVLCFYQSLCGIPSDLLDVAQMLRLSPWKRFWTLELPAGAGGLIWNSVISVAGGWFFLISIESFELGNRDFRLPGLGSFLAAAAEAGDYLSIFAGLVTLIAIIVSIDFFIWRPLIAWSTKFASGGSNSREERPRSLVLNILQRSQLLRSIHEAFLGPMWERFVNLSFTMPVAFSQMVPSSAQTRNGNGNEAGASSTFRIPSQIANLWKSVSKFVSIVLPRIVSACFACGVGVSVWQAGTLMQGIPFSQWIELCTSALCTFGRVFVALGLSLMWTVPAGVAIGRNPKLAATVQPLVQIAASVPATALFPFVLLFLARLGGGLQIGSIALMMLGTMWYVLFNVIAGAQAIPAELFEVDAVYNKEGKWKLWRTLVLPGIFPYLITGVVSAVGGAWNASIVSEYVVFRGGIMKTHGLGSLISEAAASGNYALLLAGTVVMSLLVLLTNRLVWDPLYRLSESKYKL